MTECWVRLRKVGEVKEYCPLSENIFCAQGGLLDVEHFVFNVRHFDCWELGNIGARVVLSSG